MAIMIKPICDCIFHLAEGPLWNPKEQCLYWTNILNGEIWKFDENTKKSELYWRGDMMVGGFAFAADGSMIFCSNKGIFRLPVKKGRDLFEIPGLIYEIPYEKNERFNDITTDPAGRIFAGTKTEDLKNGKLWRIEKGKEPIVILDGIKISNGMTFSLDQKYFYHTDSIPCKITRYKYDIQTGDISEPETFYQGNSSTGFPDGVTLDANGNIWVAFWGASCIRCISPAGKIIDEIEIPAIQVSSLNIGGKEMNTIFVTTACEGGFDLEKGLDEKGNFLGGFVYALPLNIKGREEWYAEVF